ncbi:hypothetical protein TanjilG_21253 [Lupinus angustifolius]|uniref:HIT domain-containing protein n=1 Tax=Lupinus angustifolius TaxID=3871 RepID=A0A4P1RMB3_LUPAN|nr:hypothetical protein TanjilG_21253 [Lupinus angustifolius]
MAAEYYDFGPHKIPQSSVFYTTDLSFAFVNLRPIVPVKRVADLTAEEITEMWIIAQKLGRKLESYHKASSLTFVIQKIQKYLRMVIFMLPFRKVVYYENSDEIYEMDKNEKELKQSLTWTMRRKIEALKRCLKSR